MRIIPVQNVGEVSMDPRVRYTNSIKGHEAEKRHLRMTDKEEAEYLKRRAEYRRKLREANAKRHLL